MPNRMQPVNLADFTGGINLRRNQFQLAPNESPEMENIAIDPLGGIYTRKGWSRYNAADIVGGGVTWNPRRALLLQLTDGTDLIYLASDRKLYTSTGAGTTQVAGVVCDATPHMVDFAVFGDDVYFACGREYPMARRTGLAAATLLTAASSANWNDDFLTPVHGVAPQAEVCESHAGYLFVANTEEDGLDKPNRLRWSHATSQDDWSELDYIDIGTGGSHITALISYEDHLLIFKPDSIWALYGYDADSWQLIQKSSTLGTSSPQAVSRSEVAVFFYSGSDKGSVYAYAGERPSEIGAQLRPAFEAISGNDLIWVGWLGRKLWVTVPWDYDLGPTPDSHAAFVFDPAVGEGAWAYYTSEAGKLGPLVGGSNIDSQATPVGVLRDKPIVVRLDHLDQAADRVVGTTDVAFTARYRTPWVTADWPTRKKSWRRADYICRISGAGYELAIESFRDYEERNVARRHTVTVPPSGAGAMWGHFVYGDGTLWGEGGPKRGGLIRRGSSQGMCRAIQLRLNGVPQPGVYSSWGVDGIVLKVVMRRFR